MPAQPVAGASSTPGRNARRRQLSHPAITARLRAAGCVFAEDEARLLIAAASGARLSQLVDRRVAGVPLEHVLGFVEFCGLRLAIEDGVFVPRRRTEFLVATAAALLTDAPTPPGAAIVIDLCCGCGAVGAALAAVTPIELYAVDLDPVAVRCARRNLAAARAQVLRGDLDAPLPAGLHGRVDLLVANAPYVPTAAIALMPPEARLYEPTLALDGGADGLGILRRIAAAAHRWLAPFGHLAAEIGRAQAPAALEVLSGFGWRPWLRHDDELDATIVVARRGRSA